MKPKPSPCEDLQGDLFKLELQAIVDETLKTKFEGKSRRN